MKSSPPVSRISTSSTAAKILDHVEIAGIPMAQFVNVPSGDYWTCVQRMRDFNALAQDPETLCRFLADIDTAFEQVLGSGINERIPRNFLQKNTIERFSRLEEERDKVIAAQSSLLSSTNFDDCLAQYKALIAHVELSWANACNFYIQANYPLATFLSILVIEEIGKLTNLFSELVYFDTERPVLQAGRVNNSHKRKQLIGIFFWCPNQ